MLSRPETVPGRMPDPLDTFNMRRSAIERPVSARVAGKCVPIGKLPAATATPSRSDIIREARNIGRLISESVAVVRRAVAVPVDRGGRG
jgi:hypothetical protein